MLTRRAAWDVIPASPTPARAAEWRVVAWPGGGSGPSDPCRGLPPLWRDLLPDRVPGRRAPLDVLIVEDDTAIAEMYQLQLEVDGYRVRVVGTAADALREIGQDSPDLVLLDVLLPGRDGFSVLEHLHRTDEPTPPVVILSNYGEPAMVDRGLRLGAVDYFVKSRVTPDLVSRSIPTWLKRARDLDD